jgi:hypothetical protein
MGSPTISTVSGSSVRARICPQETASAAINAHVGAAEQFMPFA